MSEDYRTLRRPEKTEILGLKRDDFASITQEVLGRGISLRFRAKGGSMSPVIRNDDIVQVAPLEGKINLGDVILYRSSYENPIIHRVVRINKESVITKGDSTLNLDQPVLSKQVLGRVVSVEKTEWRIRLDRPMGRFINILLAIISPHSLRLMKAVGVLVVPVLHGLSQF